MIRAKGGRRQPRYFALKEKATTKLICYMEQKPRAQTQASGLDVLSALVAETSQLIATLKAKYA
jgi:hypothetical protein